MPAFARTAVPQHSDRRKHGCHCGGKCGSCAAKKRDQRVSPAGGGRGHDFARIAVDRKCQGGGHDVDGAAACDVETGQVEICINRETCAGEFTRKHEEVHKEHRLPCCQLANKCWTNAKTDADKEACKNAYEAWRFQTEDWSECEASKAEEMLILPYRNLNCEGGGNDPAIGAGIGAGLGAIGGAVGGAFAGPAIFGSALSTGGAQALGGVLGGVLGAGVGALLGFGIGSLIRYIRRDNVSEACCDQLRDVELWGAQLMQKQKCPGTFTDCPFDANGKIIAPAAKPTATFNQATAGEAAA